MSLIASPMADTSSRMTSLVFQMITRNMYLRACEYKLHMNVSAQYEMTCILKSVCGRNPSLWPFKGELLSSIFSCDTVYYTVKGGSTFKSVDEALCVTIQIKVIEHDFHVMQKVI